MPPRKFTLYTAVILSLGLLVGVGAARAVAGVSTKIMLTITSPSSIYFGQTVTGDARVTASDGSTPGGTITFYDGAQSICLIPAVQSASCPASTEAAFTAGTHVLMAVYSGDASHTRSSSNVVTVTVLPDETTTRMVSSVNPAALGQSVTFTATVAGSYAKASGMVIFFDGSTEIGRSVLSSGGVASLSTTALGVGNHAVTASYVGNVNTVPSAATALTETVTGGGVAGQNGFSITVASSAKVGVGRMVNLTVTVVPVQGFWQPVELSCADLPSEAACTFGMQTIPAGGGATTLELSTIAPHDCGSAVPYFQSAGLPFAGPAVAGLVMLFVPRKKRGVKGLVIALVAVCGMATLTGCGNCTDLGTRPGSYTVRVIGRAVGAGSSVNAKIKMDVSLE